MISQNLFRVFSIKKNIYCTIQEFSWSVKILHDRITFRPLLKVFEEDGDHERNIV